MTSPRRFLTRMTLFVLLVAVLFIFLFNPLQDAFLANAVLNGVILGVLIIGIAFSFRLVLRLSPEIAWVETFKRGEESTTVAEVPTLLAPVAAMLAEEDQSRVRLSALSARSLLDSIAARLDEGREILRYLIGLLIFLGLLGTFWGLLGTIQSIGSTINSLSVSANDAALMFDDLKAGLEAPLSGMATAFSSSLFGLAGSVILGFLDLQVGQGMNRFYNDLEEWISSFSKLSRASALGGEEGGSASAYTTALVEQSADSLDKLQRVIERSEESRREVNAALMALSEQLASLNDQTAAGHKLMTRMVEGQEETANALNRAAKGFEGTDISLDDATKGHLRNMDVHLKKLLEAEEAGRNQLVDELRNEFKLLARTLSVMLDQAKKD